MKQQKRDQSNWQDRLEAATKGSRGKVTVSFADATRLNFLARFTPLRNDEFQEIVTLMDPKLQKIAEKLQNGIA